MAFGTPKSSTSNLKIISTSLRVILLLNFVLFAALLGIASWGFNRLIDGQFIASNAASGVLIVFSTVAGVLGMISVASGFQALQGKSKSNAAAMAIGSTAWGMSLITFGLACKQIHLGKTIDDTMKALEVLAIAVAGTQFLYLLVAHSTLIK